MAASSQQPAGLTSGRPFAIQVKSQSIIKLYMFYNMLEVGDKLMSSFGQDSLDALHWTATEPRRRKRQHLGTLPHFFLATVYVCILTQPRPAYGWQAGAGEGRNGIRRTWRDEMR